MVYVFIPCRLDTDLRYTLEDLYQKATKPAEVKTVVVNQDLPENRWHQRDFDYISKNILLISIDEDRFAGLPRVRSLAKSFRPSNAKYILFIDAHTRFDQDWDRALINKYQQHWSGAKVVFSVYPNAFYLPDSREPYVEYNVNSFNKHWKHNRRYDCGPNMKDKNASFAKSAIAGGFLFSTIDWIEEVGFRYDQEFGWDEIQASYESVVNGYEILSFKYPPVYHLYSHENRKTSRVHGDVDMMGKGEDMFVKLLTHEGIRKFDSYYEMDFKKWLNVYTGKKLDYRSGVGYIFT